MKKSVLKGLVLAGSVVATNAMANDDISAAITAGQANVSTVVAGVIGLAALGFGISMIVGFLRR
jgi:hypothetical protein